MARHLVVAAVSLAVPPWNRVGRELVPATPMVVEHLHSPGDSVLYTNNYNFLGFLVVRTERLVNLFPLQSGRLTLPSPGTSLNSNV